MGNDLKLRRWQLEDCRLLYNWRIHPANRRWFGNQGEIAFVDHHSWFRGFLADSARIGFILEVSQLPVAQIRFEPAEMPGCLRISLSTAPKMSGKGYGSFILNHACASAEVRAAASLLVAETMVENVPSQKIFARNGFAGAGNAQRGQHAMLCWARSAGLLGEPLPIQIVGDCNGSAELEKMLAATGLAYVSDDAAVRIFFAAATIDADLSDSMVFHLNSVDGRSILDLALRQPMPLSLPITFDNNLTAVAQLAAAVRHHLQVPVQA